MKFFIPLIRIVAQWLSAASAYIGRFGELTIDPEAWELRGHDGFTPGGIPFRTDVSNVTRIAKVAKTNSYNDLDNKPTIENYHAWLLRVSQDPAFAYQVVKETEAGGHVYFKSGTGIEITYNQIEGIHQITFDLDLAGLATIVNPTLDYYIPVTGGTTNTKIAISTLASLIGAGLPDAPTDGSTYGRRNATWVAISGGGGIPDAPIDGTTYGRRNATWVAISGGGGTTIHSSLSNLDYDSSGHSGFARLAGSSSQAFAASTLTCSSTATATNFILSDRRLKENITRLKSLDKFDGLNWYNFELISDKGHKRYGVIAQELEQIAPELVKENDQGMKMVNYIDLLVAKIARLEEQIKEMKGISKCLV